MEEEKKRKRAEDSEVGGGGRRRKEREEEVKAEAAPKEEEVEEFFAILRRMHVAVKYFQTNGGDGRKLKGRWGAALEAEVLAAAAEGVKAAEESVVNEVRDKGGLDLNAVPEAESI